MEIQCPHQCFINGQFVDATLGKTYDTINPTDESVSNPSLIPDLVISGLIPDPVNPSLIPNPVLASYQLVLFPGQKNIFFF